jgi:hypothetical protein
MAAQSPDSYLSTIVSWEEDVSGDGQCFISDESWISAALSQNKHEWAHQLMDMGVYQLTTVDDSHQTVPSHLFTAHSSQGAPSKEDLIAAVKKWLDEHPDHNRTVVEQLMDDENYSIIYTPPGVLRCSRSNFMGKVEATSGRSCDSQAIRHRGTRRQTEEGFAQITNKFCNNVVSIATIGLMDS